MRLVCADYASQINFLLVSYIEPDVIIFIIFHEIDVYTIYILDLGYCILLKNDNTILARTARSVHH